jgi:dipeptidyl aminopeptidase/acylaminoacyl peptidase
MLCLPSWAQGTREDYERALSLARRTERTVFRAAVEARWFDGGKRFWYRVETGPDTHEFIVVDAEAGRRNRAFDHGALARALTQAGAGEYSGENLGLDNLEFESGSVQFGLNGVRWRWHGERAVLERLGELAPPGVGEPKAGVAARSRSGGEATTFTFHNASENDVELFWVDTRGERRSYGRLRPGQRREQHTYIGHVWLGTDVHGRPLAWFDVTGSGGLGRIDGKQPTAPKPEAAESRVTEGTPSPDGRWTAVVRDHNVFLREAASGVTTQLGRDGSAGEPYAREIAWAPDSSRFVAVRVRMGQDHDVVIVESAPGDQLQPKVHRHRYLKPGDVLPRPRPVLFAVSPAGVIQVDDALFANPFSESGDLDVSWAPDSSYFRFSYNERGHQRYRLLRVDAGTGDVQVVVEETSRTFIDWTNKTWRHWLDAGREVLWMSERDGWCHLWLYDVPSASVKQQVTRGPWVVRRVEHVDATNRVVWFFAGGLRAGEDPYHLHLCKVNLDGSGFVRLTDGDGTHRVAFSPDRRYFVDTWSRADHPPVSELRRAEDGGLVLELERADCAALLAAGWRMPERFVAKGRDGQTDIHGILVTPSNFDPQRRYPVVEEVYAGPQGSFAPKQFSRLLRQHAIAELGFVVVQADGMGTNDRGKAFHEICWRNLADAGFADRIAWLRAAAATRPYMDLRRVGIYGGSAGGQNAMRALLDHSDFYRVAVADCGCHDNRMDKVWWNEQWLGWPVSEAYERSSNVADAHKLQGKLLLIVGELDTNVDPASTFQVVNALQRADKDYELVVMTGTNHGAAETPYASRRRMDFLVRHLWGVEPRRELSATIPHVRE